MYTASQPVAPVFPQTQPSVSLTEPSVPHTQPNVPVAATNPNLNYSASTNSYRKEIPKPAQPKSADTSSTDSQSQVQKIIPRFKPTFTPKPVSSYSQPQTLGQPSRSRTVPTFKAVVRPPKPYSSERPFQPISVKAAQKNCSEM